jgi:hypothetical protein
MKIIENLPNSTYHTKDGYYSSSMLKLYLSDRTEFYHKYILGLPSEDPTSAAFTFGSYVHSLILEPDKTPLEYHVTDLLSRRGNIYKDLQKEVGGDKTIILKMQHEQAMTLVEAIKSKKVCLPFISGGKAEVSLYGELENVKVKVRADYFIESENEIKIVDLKTSSDPVYKSSVVNTCKKFDYDLSAALYVDLFKQVFPSKNVSFYFLFLGKSDTKANIFLAGDSFLDSGREKYKAAIEGIKNTDWSAPIKEEIEVLNF